MTHSDSRHAAEEVFPCANTAFAIPGPAGELEALSTCPSGENPVSATAIVCHPHPLHGGSMQNKVVHTLVRGFGEMGLRTVRFNFRGVGRSHGGFDQGAGETDDLLAVVEWVRRRRPRDQIWLAGFSFGAYVALRASARFTLHQLVLVAPPVNLYAFDALPPPPCPLLVIQGGADEVVPAAEVRRWADTLTPPPRLVYFEGVSHFFHLRLNDLRAALTQTLTPYVALLAPHGDY